MKEFDDEPIHGLPAELPEGERLLWQGSPVWDHLARQAFHTRGVTIYFVLLALWQAGSALTAEGGSLGAALVAVLWVAVPAAAALGVLNGLAWAYARGTVYTVTNHRIVIRSGLALTMAIDVPFKLIAGASLKSYGDGTGDVVISIAKPDRVSFVLLWPNVRPWRITQPEPMLRCIPEASLVASLLARELRHDVEAAQDSASDERDVQAGAQQATHDRAALTPALS